MQCFKNVVGNSPLQYLATVHLQKAIDLLAETTDTLEAVSQAVG